MELLQNMRYEEIGNSFIIEIECDDSKREILNSCLKEKIFRKRLSDSEVYMSIFLENAIYYRIRGRKSLEK